MEWTREKDLTTAIVVILITCASFTLYFSRVRGMEIIDSAQLTVLIMIPVVVMLIVGFIIGILILRATGRESLW